MNCFINVTITLLVVTVIKYAAAKEGIISVKFTEYTNPTGKAINGQCCDGRAFLCEKHGCDYIFKICLNAKDNTTGSQGCQFGYKESKRIRNRDNVLFGRYIGGLHNPMIFPINKSTPQVLLLEVNVYDKDGPFTGDDFVDFLRVKVNLRPGVQRFSIRGGRSVDKTSLRGEIQVLYNGVDGSKPFTTTTDRSKYGSDILFVDWPNADCENLARHGYHHQSGVYSLRIAHFKPFLAYCQMSDKGWTVIQQRINGSESFFRNWTDYVEGFGDIGEQTDYWLGLENIYRLTNQRRYKLHISLQMADGVYVYAEYERFRLNADYALYVSGYSGTAGDALTYRGFGGRRLHNGAFFSTYDHDSDMWTSGNCGLVYQSGWWFNDCYWANLNGIYRRADKGWPYCDEGRCIAWRTITGYDNFSLIKTEMKILPAEAGINNS